MRVDRTSFDRSLLANVRLPEGAAVRKRRGQIGADFGCVTHCPLNVGLGSKGRVLEVQGQIQIGIELHSP